MKRQRNLLYSQNKVDAFPPPADRKLQSWSHSANAFRRPPPHEHENPVCFVSVSAISAHTMLYHSYVPPFFFFNFIASGWVDQKDPHSLFFFCLLSTFHAVIGAKGRIKAALPWSQPSLFRLVKEGKLGGRACFGAKGLQDLLSGESSGFQRPRGSSRVAGKTQASGFFLFSEMYF